MNRIRGKRRWIILAAVIVVLAVVITLCVRTLTSSEDEQEPTIHSVQSDSTFVVGLPEEPTSLNIRTNNERTVEQALLGNVYETLVKRDNKNALTPGMAKSWDISPDALTYTFHLNSGMSFADGDPLNSTDVVWSLQQVLSHRFVGYENLGDVASVKNPDSHTVVITLHSPNPRLLRALSNRPGIVYDRKQDDSIDYNKEASGSGPFIVGGFHHHSLILKRNNQYWGTKAKASQIELRYYSNETSLVDDLNNNVINMALPRYASSLEEASTNPTFTINTGFSLQKILLGFNCSNNSPLSDQQVRKAVRYAINAPQIARTMPDSKEQLSGPIGPLNPGYENLNSLFPFDQAKAQQMLSYFPAGYTGTLDMLVQHHYENLGRMIEKNLTEAGFSVNLEVLDQATLQDRVNAGDYTMAIMMMRDQYDYTQFLDPNSVFHYENGAAQQEYDTAISSKTLDEYKQHLANFARIVSEDAASEWLYTRKDFVVTKARLHGYPTNMTGHYLPLVNLDR